MSLISGWRAFTLLAIAVLAAHGLTLLAPFQFDDQHQLALNPAFTDPAALPRFFTDPWIGSGLGHMASYRPLLYVSFLIEGLAGGGAAWPYRVVSLASLVLFAVAAGRFAVALLPRLARDVDMDRLQRAGLIAALLVAVHPIYGESVLMASSRSSLWMALFGLLAMTELLRREPRWPPMLFWMTLALLTKETAVTIAPLAFLLALLPDERPLARRLLALWPVVVAVGGYLLFYKGVFQGLWLQQGGGTPFPASLGKQVVGLDYVAQGGLALLGLLKLLLVPWGMSPVHDLRPPAGGLQWVGWLAWPLLAGLAALGVGRGGGARVAGFALGWFALAMLPTLALVPLNTPFAEHRTALAVVVPLAAAGWWLAGIVTRRRALVASLAGVLALLAALQAWPWRSERALWEHQVQVVPHSARAWGFLAATYHDDGDLAAAGRANREALAIAPSNPLLLARAARLALDTGDRARAAAFAARGLEIEPNLATLRDVAVRLAAAAGRYDEALVHARALVELVPRDSTAWNALGNVRWLRGELEAGAEAYRRALEFDPGNEMAAENLAAVEYALARP